MSDLTPDQVDAILRDPNTPGDVRATVLADYTVTRYLGTIEFYKDSDGVTHTRLVPDPASETAPAATPAVAPTAVPDVEPDTDDTTPGASA